MWHCCLAALVVAAPVANPNEVVSAGLCSALAAAKNNNAALRSKKELTAFFGTCTKLNQKEMVGIVKYFSDLKIAGSEASAMALTESANRNMLATCSEAEKWHPNSP